MAERLKWGTGVTPYSGLGLFLFHGQVLVKDLPVGRTHRHFNSGIHQSDSRAQPQQVTDCRKSIGRLNDQVLPKPFDHPFDPIATNSRLVEPGRDPWHLFQPINEVFPLNEQDRVDCQGNHILTDATRHTLTNYYHHLRCVPRQQDAYPDHYRQPVPDPWNSNQRTLPIYTQRRFSEPLFCMNPYDVPRGALSSSDDLALQAPDAAVNATGSCRSQSDSTINCATSATQENFEVSATGDHELAEDCDFSPEVQQAMCKLVEMFGSSVVDQLKRYPDYPNNSLIMLQSTLRDNPPETSRQPVWPPSAHYTINTKTVQIQDRNQIPATLWSSGQPQEELGAADQANGLQRSHECMENIRPEPYSPFASYYEQTNPSNKQNQYKLTQPRYEPDNTELPPLLSYLKHTGNMLGLPFKADAQRRFHDTHPEPPVDLRENHRTSKKYHFLGGQHGGALFRAQCNGLPLDSVSLNPEEAEQYTNEMKLPKLPAACKTPAPKTREVIRWNECFIDRLRQRSA